MSYNGGSPMQMTIDHKIARCLGGKNDKSNIWVMCKKHNHYKAQIEHILFQICGGGGSSKPVKEMLIPQENGAFYDKFEDQWAGSDSDATGEP